MGKEGEKTPEEIEAEIEEAKKKVKKGEEDFKTWETGTGKPKT